MEEFKLQVGVKVLIKNRENKYLLLHRNLEKYPEVNHPWDMLGGRIDSGNSLIDNLKREIYEETQLDLDIDFNLIAAQDIIVTKKNLHVVRLTYVASVENEVIPILSDEHNDFKWFSITELIELGDNLDKFLKELIDQGKIN